jgi:hypothetical protein
MNSLIEKALGLARHVPVFPCGANKRPCIPKAEGGRGFHDATQEPNEAARLFSHPNARLIATPTGPQSGFDALDVDPRATGDSWLRVHANDLPATRTHATRSGGRHFLFAHATGVVNSEGRIHAGIDVRGEGGFIIWWPAHGCAVLSDAPIVPWPAWLLAPGLARPKLAARPVGSSVGSVGGSGGASDDAAVQAFVDRVLDGVRRARDGEKHRVLRDAARLLGGVADQAGFADQTAAQWLLDALPASVRDWENARRTALWGLARGRETPVEPPEAPVTPDQARAIARVAYRALRVGAGAVAWPEARDFAGSIGVGPQGARNIFDHCVRTQTGGTP